ncbi:MAG: hypothetical protein ACK5CL_08515 [Sphingomonadales bacterium]|jgi:hypothetical protein
MVKNFFFATILLWAASATSQTCVPDTNLKKSGFLPVSLPPAKVNIPYNEGISVLTFRDTHTIVLGSKVPVKIDSIKVLSIGGLPAGINYKCQHPRCVFLWDVVRCISFYGTASQAGSYPLKIYVRAFAKVGGFTPTTQNDSISSYTLEVVNGTASLSQPNSTSFRVSPNPANDVVEIEDRRVGADWFMTDLTGRKVPFVIMDKTPHTLRFSVAALKSGIYIVTDGQRKTKLLVP